MPTQHNPFGTCQLVHGVEYLVPAVIRERFDQSIEANHGLFVEALENVSFQPLGRQKNDPWSFECTHHNMLTMLCEADARLF